ncbi:MAG: PqqD family protein [Sphingomicrobium sp.]
MSAITKRGDRFTEADIDHEIVIMRLDNGEFFSLSGTGAAIWRLIDGARDRHALIAALATEFPADQSQIASDVDEFVGHLEDSGLLAVG